MNKRILSFLAAITVVVFCAFTGPWIEYKSADGKASIKFPSKPTTSEQNVPSEIGDIAMNIASVEMEEGTEDPNLSYSFIYNDYPDSIISSELGDEVASAVLDGALEGAASNVKGEFISKETNEINGYPGRRAKILFEEGAGIMDMQVYMVKNRTYFIQVLYLAEKAENNLAAEQFMGSFKLLK